MRLGALICAVLAVVVIAWGTGVQLTGSSGSAAPEVKALAECLSDSGVAKAEPNGDTYYGSQGRVFVPGGEVFVFATAQAAQGAVTQIEADDDSPQMIGGTLNVVAVHMPEPGVTFPVAESSNCAYSSPAPG
jgi:hypothetical protein